MTAWTLDRQRTGVTYGTTLSGALIHRPTLDTSDPRAACNKRIRLHWTWDRELKSYDKPCPRCFPTATYPTHQCSACDAPYVVIDDLEWFAEDTTRRHTCQ